MVKVHVQAGALLIHRRFLHLRRI